MWRRESGQTFVEYVMITGLMTAVTIIVLGLVELPLRNILQDLTRRVIGQLIDPSFL